MILDEEELDDLDDFEDPLTIWFVEQAETERKITGGM
jgi:hypothetical protein